MILDVVFNHTAEGNENGPWLCHRGFENRAYYILSQDAAVLHELQRLRQLAQRQPVDCAPHDHGLPALLGQRTARRRLPLRPRVGAFARREGLSAAQPADSVGDRVRSGAGGDEDHRRSVGRGRSVSGRLVHRRIAGRSGTASSATTCAASSRAMPGFVSAMASRILASPDLYPDAGPRRRTAASTSSRRTTASRSTIWSRTTTSTTKPTARTIPTARATTTAGTPAGKARARDPNVERLRAAADSQFPDDPAGRRRGRR